jgi:hypothetical protein
LGIHRDMLTAIQSIYILIMMQARVKTPGG